MKFPFALIAMVLVPCGSLLAQEVGDTIVVIEDNAELKSQSDVVGTVTAGNLLRVEEVSGEWFWVNWQGASGWIKSNSIASLNQGITFYTKAIKREPNAFHYSSRANVWVALGKPDLAAKDYGAAIRLAPEEPIYYHNRATQWHQAGDFAKAISDYDEAVRLNPDYRDAYRNRGIASQAQGNLESAIDDFTYAIELDPAGAAPTYYNRGIVWHLLQNFENAIDDYRQSIRLNPNDANVHYSLASAWHSKGDLEQAIASYNKAIELNPNGVNYYYYRGSAHQAKGDIPKMVEDFNNAIRVDQSNPYPYNGLAWVYATHPNAKYRDGKKAVELATQCSKLTDYFIDTLAAAYAETGDFDAAIEWEEKAIAGAEENDKAAFRSRLELYKSGKPFRDKTLK